MAAGIGRPRGSTLWDYFEYNGHENKSECTVTTTEGLQCLIKIAGKFPTNLRKHLGKCHSEAFKESEKKEEKNTGSAKVRISLVAIHHYVQVGECLPILYEFISYT